MIENVEFVLRVGVLLLVAYNLAWTLPSARDFARGLRSVDVFARTFAFVATLAFGLFTLRHLFRLHENIPLTLLLLVLKIVAMLLGVFWSITAAKNRQKATTSLADLKEISDRIREDIRDGL